MDWLPLSTSDTEEAHVSQAREEGEEAFSAEVKNGSQGAQNGFPSASWECLLYLNQYFLLDDFI